jgi:AAA family ATP:ADP antiporter
VLFWSFANRYTHVDDAKRIYPIMGIIANLALILGGLVMHTSGTVFAHDWNMNVQALTLGNLGMSVIAMVLFVSFTRTFTPLENNTPLTEPKRNTSLKDNVVELGRNPFVRNMVVMISSYGLLVGFYETIWKHYLKLYLPSPITYSKFMAAISFCTGVFTIGLMGVTSYWLERVSWTKLALITPVAMLGFGSVFFLSVQTKSVVIVSFAGAALTVFLKGAKYSLFDPCKEIAYIPMNDDIKIKGKATIEILSAPIGKSGSNCVLQLFVVLFGSIESGASIVGILYVLTAAYWIYSTKVMGKLIENNMT